VGIGVSVSGYAAGHGVTRDHYGGRCMAQGEGSMVSAGILCENARLEVGGYTYAAFRCVHAQPSPPWGNSMGHSDQAGVWDNVAKVLLAARGVLPWCPTDPIRSEGLGTQRDFSSSYGAAAPTRVCAEGGVAIS
jgi:hypothetical protein